MQPREDMRGLAEDGNTGALSRARFLAEAMSADVNEDLHWNDPLPGLVVLAEIAGRRFDRLVNRHDENE